MFVGEMRDWIYETKRERKEKKAMSRKVTNDLGFVCTRAFTLKDMRASVRYAASQ